MAWIGESDFAARAVQFAEEVVDGQRTFCRQIRQACARFLADVDGDEWTLSGDRAEHVCRFAELLPHTKGAWASKRELLKLEEWQVFVLVAIFAFEGADGLRKVREAFLLIPRKNGKSFIAAVIALYMAFLDGEGGAEVWIGANSMDQAEACFGPCRQMAQRTPELMEAFDIEVLAKRISTSEGSFISAMIAKPGDGSNPHCAILDEAHENDSSEQYDTMKTGMGSREQPLILTITTAGFNLAGPCRQRQLDAEAVLNGTVKNDALFAAIFTVDEDDDWQDFDTWKKANPNLGVSVKESFLRRQYEDALNKPSEKPSLLTKHLNVWQNSSTGWLSQLDWMKCVGERSIDDLAGQPAYIGFDLSTRLDITAVVLVTMDGDSPAIFPFMFVPEGAIEGNKNASAYLEWIEAGHLIKTEGNSVDFALVKETILELADKFSIQGIAYDQWQGEQLAQELFNDHGMNVQKFVGVPKYFSPVMRHFEALVADHKLRHPDNPCLNWMTSRSPSPVRAQSLNLASYSSLPSSEAPRRPDFFAISETSS